jgi:type II secretory pathway pseudopilin PulG
VPDVSPDPRGRGISLIEVLVVLGIIGVLLAVLLPTLSGVRSAARLTTDLSHQRQLASGLLAFAHAEGMLPTVSNSAAARSNERVRMSSTFDGDDEVLPWYAAISRYVGDDSDLLLQCPADPGRVTGGYLLPSGPIDRRVPVSYGINADLAATNVGSGTDLRRTALGPAEAGNPFGDFIGVYGADRLYPGEQHHGAGVSGRLSQIDDPSRTLLLADAAVPATEELDPPSFLDRVDLLLYTTNYMAYNDADPAKWGRLSGVLQTPWLADRVPLDRHREESSRVPGRGGVLPIAFVDGSAMSVRRSGFDRVKVTPFDLRKVPMNGP